LKTESFTLQPLARCVALACTLWATGAAAQEVSCELHAAHPTSQNFFAGTSQPLVTNPCLRPMREGRAAVLLPAVSRTTDGVHAQEAPGQPEGEGPAEAATCECTSGRGGDEEPDGIELRWGFLDPQGQLAVAPRFDDVADFQHGLAAAREGAKWGFIDPQGRWVIEPRFVSTTGFSAIGLAAVQMAMEDGGKEVPRWVLIDRKGQPVGVPFAPEVQAVELGQGQPVRATLHKASHYLSPTGERRDIPADRVLDKAFGDAGLFVASNPVTGLHGIVDAQWQWLTEPAYNEIRLPDGPGGAAFAIGEDDVALIGANGSVVVRGYRRLHPAGQFIVGERAGDEATLDLLDPSGALVRQFDPRVFDDLQMVGGFLAEKTRRGWSVFVPGQARPVLLSPAVAQLQPAEGFVLLLDRKDKVTGLMSPSGRLVQGQAHLRWLAQTEKYEFHQGRLWLHGKNGALLNIVSSDGQLLLNEKSRQLLRSRTVSVLPVAQNPAASSPLPVARITRMDCGCGPDGAGLLLSDGTLVFNLVWSDITSLEPEEGAAPSRPEDWRFSVKTEAGFGLIDGTGRELLKPEYENIGPFLHGHTLVYRKGQMQAVGRDGGRHALPDYFEAELVSPTMVRFHETAADDALWGLYDFVAQKVAVAPSLHDVRPFELGMAPASTEAGKWGVIDAGGKWMLPPGHAAVERLTEVLWSVASQPAGSTSEDDRRWAVVHADGRTLVPATSSRPVLDDGLVVVRGEDKQGWLFKPDGQPLGGTDPASFSRIGSWLLVQPASLTGYLDGQGQWRIAPGAAQGSEFNPASGRALRHLADKNVLIGSDGRTLATLPDADWTWPASSDWLIAHGTDEKFDDITHYADPGSGQPTVTVPGRAGPFEKDRAVRIGADRRMAWINRQGKAISEAVYDDLGLPSHELAYAATHGRYGFINAQERFVIPPVYDAVTPFTDGVAVATAGRAAMLIDTSGAPVARVVEQCGMRVLYGADHKRRWPAELPDGCDAQ
jgi:hypothetical protein